MKRCEFCRMELPDEAQYCGNCGHRLGDINATVSDISIPNEFGSTLQTPLPLRDQPDTDIQASGIMPHDTYATRQTYWSFEGTGLVNPQGARQTDEHDYFIPDALLPGMLAMHSQLPSAPQPPMVQGTPQFGGVPSVQGTPATPGNVAQSVPGSVHAPASSAPSNAPLEAQANPVYHRHVQQPAHQQQPVYHQSPVSHQPPVLHQPPIYHQPVPPVNEIEHKHHTGPLHKHKTHSVKLNHSTSASSKAGMSVVSKWLIVAVISVVIIGSSSVFLAHALMPSTPSLPPKFWITGSSVVRDGDVLQVQGQGFQPGDSIALTIDNGLSVFLAGQHGTQAVLTGTERSTHLSALSLEAIGGVFHSQSSIRSNITVSSTGTFSANVLIPSNLPGGSHILHATDSKNSQNASLQFTVNSAQLVVNPTALNFGSVEVGRSVKLMATLSNQGGVSLHWSATIQGANSSWLTLSKNNDALGTHGANETVIVTANTNGLSVGPLDATVRFHSENGDVLVAVSINVVSPGNIGQQAILNVSPQSLDFGQQQASQSAQKNISIANLGNLPLQWQASVDAASTNWLSLSTANGTVQSGAVPQSLQVNVDISGLMAGSYTGTVNVTSNGGHAQVNVTLVVMGSSVTPTPSPTIPTQPTTPTQVPTQPTQPPVMPQITVTPQNLDQASSQCSQNSDGTYSCNVTVGESAPGNLSWFAPTTIGGTSVSFNPSNGQLTTSQTQQSVAISSIPCSNASFTFTDQNNNTATVAWNCTPPTQIPTQTVPPSLNWSVNPTSLDGSTCGQTASCQVTLTEDLNSTGNINWSASSNIGATFKPPSGTLSPNAQQNSVTISITAPCQSDTFTFNGSGGVKPLTMSWSCTPTPTPTLPPVLTVSPSGITNCPQNSDGSWTCTLTLSLANGSQGTLPWSSSSDLPGVTFSPSSGTLDSSQSSIQVSINIPSNDCKNGNMYFAGQNSNTIDVTWSCGS